MTKSDILTTHRAKTVTCPTCGGESIYGESNPQRPFCSQRCRDIDLGNWANEDFRVQMDPEVNPNLLARDPST